MTKYCNFCGDESNSQFCSEDCRMMAKYGCVPMFDTSKDPDEYKGSNPRVIEVRDNLIVADFRKEYELPGEVNDDPLYDRAS